jgi:hypothetical protein
MLHPVVLGALAALIVNDHVLKAMATASWAGVVTGKLSDLAGLLLAPVLLGSVVEVAGRRCPVTVLGWPVTGLAAVLTGVVFALVKLTATGEAGYEVALGGAQWLASAAAALVAGRTPGPYAPVDLVRDLTDLWTLLILPVAVRVGRNAPGPDI